MRGTRRSPGGNNCIFTAVQSLEARRLLSAAIAQVPAGWSAEPMFRIPVGASLNGNATGGTTPLGYTPAQIQGAYGVGNISFAGTAGTGAGQTIAIVDAFDDPNALTDLQAFDTAFGLPDPPHFEKLNDQGRAAPLPGTDPAGPGASKSWEMEESLDIEWAHAIAPDANIILFEANDNGQDLYNTVLAAANTPGVDVVSMSWGGAEFSGETALDTDFTTPSGQAGITFLASAGDSGAFADNQNTIQPNYPAASPNILAVGGTTLTLSGDSYVGETAWGNSNNSWQLGGGGGGISQYESQPAYQSNAVSSISKTQRVYPDVSMEADPNTGVAVYDSYDFGTTTAWLPFPLGGTSLACPMWAGLISIVDQGRSLGGQTSLDGATQTLPDIYQLPSSDFHDIVTGNNGYAAGDGYDLASGLGSPIADRLVPALVSGQAITGTIFVDSNSDGIMDNGETGLAGVTVELLDPGANGQPGGGDDTVLATQTTQATGIYGFFVGDGTYFVMVQRPTGYYFTSENIGGSTLNSNVNSSGQSAVFTLSATAPSATVNAGVVPTGIKISGVVWNDSDVNPTTYLPNGIYDNGESGPAGSTVELFMQGNSTALATQTTGNGGSYSFGSLDAGTYYIFVTPPTDYLFTLQNQGTDPKRQSIANQTTGQSSTITLGINQSDTHANVGIYLPRVFITPPTTAPGTTLGQTTPMVFPTVLYVFPGQAITNPVTIDYLTEDQSAVAGTDYNETTGESEIDPGQTQPAQLPTVPLINTDTLAPNKVFLLNVASTNSDIVDPTVIATIANDVPDGISVDASKASVTATPAGVVANFTVSLAAPVDQPVTVYYAIGAAGDTAIGATPAQIQDGSVKLNSVDYLAPSLTGAIVFPAGTTTQPIPVLVLDNFGAANGFNIINSPDKTFTLTLTNATDAGSTTPLALTTPTGVGRIADDPVQNLNVGGTGTTYVDNSGNTVTVTLNGPGSAAVQTRGGENSDGIRIVLSGTTAGSQLNIKTNGQTSINEIDDDSPLGAINAPNVNLTGNMSLQGGLGKLTLNSITPTNLIIVPSVNVAPGVQITVGGGPLASISKLNIVVGRVTDTSIDSGTPIGSFKATSFSNQDGQPNQISAPSIASLIVSNDFQENIQINSLGRFTVGGTIANSSILSTVSIGPVVTGSLINSLLFAGITPGTNSLPTSDSFFTSGSSIKSVTLKGKGATFSNSSIAAAVVGPLNLGRIQTATDVPYFGVAGLELLGVRGSTGSPVSIPKETKDLGTIFSDQQFLIQVFGV